MAVQTLTDSGSNSYVAALLNGGYSQESILGKLQERFPTASARDVRTAYDRGAQSWRAGTELAVGGADQTVPASRIPRGAVGATGYRYTATVELLEPGPGGGPVLFGHRNFEIQSHRNLTQGEVVQQLQQAAQFRYFFSDHYDPERAPSEGWSVGEVDIISIERF